MPAPDYAAEIAQLESALGRGELTVESNGERVTYRSTDALLNALAYYRREAAKNARGGRASSATTLAVFERD